MLYTIKTFLKLKLDLTKNSLLHIKWPCEEKIKKNKPIQKLQATWCSSSGIYPFVRSPLPSILESPHTVCDIRFHFTVKPLLQSEHLKGRSPVCIFMCTFKLHFWVKCLIADWSAVRFITCVYSYVWYERTHLREWLTTHGTAVRFAVAVVFVFLHYFFVSSFHTEWTVLF